MGKVIETDGIRVKAVLFKDDEETKKLVSAIADEVYSRMSWNFDNINSRLEQLQKQENFAKGLGEGLSKGMRGY